MNIWPKRARVPSPEAIRLRCFIRGEVRHVSWVEPDQMIPTIDLIRKTFHKFNPHESYTLVGDRGNVSAILWRHATNQGSQS